MKPKQLEALKEYVRAAAVYEAANLNNREFCSGERRDMDKAEEVLDAAFAEPKDGLIEVNAVFTLDEMEHLEVAMRSQRSYHVTHDNQVYVAQCESIQRKLGFKIEA